MGLFDDLTPDINKINDFANSAFGGKSTLIGQGGIYDQAKTLKAIAGNGRPWEFLGKDWYQVFGYQFAVLINTKTESNFGAKFAKGDIADKDISDVIENSLLYTLPIPPQSMNIRMIPASQVTPTFGGVVEETGANVFWLISMSGTTGIGVSRNADTGNALTGASGIGLHKDPNRDVMAKQFRDKITTTGLLSGPLAGINSVLGKIGNVADSIKNVADDPSVSGMVDAVTAALLPPLPYGGSAVSRISNGYTEMQELHRFLYTYSKLKAEHANKFSLKFRNFKTNQEWNCILQDFQVSQNSQNPMLWRYNIQLKCWNVQKPNKDLRAASNYDRFGKGGDLKSVNTIDLLQMADLTSAMWKKTGATFG